MKFVILFISHPNKIGTLLCILILMLFGHFIFNDPNSGFFVSFLKAAGLVAVIKFLFGGWFAQTIKWMGWSVLLSSIAAIFLCYNGMKISGHSISIWIMLIPLILGIICGYSTFNMVNDSYTDDFCENTTTEDLLDSAFENGFKNTALDLMDVLEDGLYGSVAYGVAVYSNVVIVTSLLINCIYRAL